MFDGMRNYYHIHTFLPTDTYIHIYIHTYILRTYIHIYICTYVHTYIHDKAKD